MSVYDGTQSVIEDNNPIDAVRHMGIVPVVIDLLYNYTRPKLTHNVSGMHVFCHPMRRVMTVSVPTGQVISITCGPMRPLDIDD
jgi:hypothetical protein